MEIAMNEIDFQRLSYPRVSDIIHKQNEAELRGIPLETLANASIRGTKIHAYCSIFVKGLWASEIEEEYQPYVDEFIRWYEENVHHTLFSSTRLYDDVKRFTGEFDMIVVLKKTKQIALIDIKTSSVPSKSWPIQLAAYKHLCEINDYTGVEKIYNIHLKKMKSPIFEIKGEEKVMISPPRIKAKEIEYTNLSQYWEIFSSALACYDYFDRKEVQHAIA